MARVEDLKAFVLVAGSRSFRGAARASGVGASSLSDAVRRLEDDLGTRLLHRTTRSVVPTEAGLRLLQRLEPALAEVEAALDGVSGDSDKPKGTLRLNVPVSAARLVLPALVPPFLASHPGIHLEVVAEEGFVDIVAAGCDAGIRYDERLQQDMIAVPIGPRRQRFATAASPDFLARHGVPLHPDDLARHACIRSRFPGRPPIVWEFERDGETIRVEPEGPLMVQAGAAADLAVSAALDGLGIVSLFEDWLRPHLESGALVPVLEPWWQSFSGPFLYYPGRRLPPAPLRAFVDFIKMHRGAT